MIRFRIAVLAGLLAYSAGAAVTLGTSTQAFVLTGTGLNSSGSGTSRVTLGACAYDGTNTTCTLSGPYTGLGEGGTYQIVFVYAGNGLSTLSAVTTPASNNLFSFSLTGPGTLSFYLTPTGGAKTQFYDLNFSIFYSGSATCTGVSTCSTSAVGQSQGGVITGPVTGTSDPTPTVTAAIAASAYGGFSAICPGDWIEIYGLNLATTLTQTWSGSDFQGVNAPTFLSGTSVTVGGKPGFMYFVSPHQVNVQVPSGIATGKQNIVVTTAGGPSVGTSVTVNAQQPGLLAPAAFKVAAGQYIAALFPNGATFVLPPGLTTSVPTARAKPGDVLTLYGVGFGTVTPNIDAGQIVQQTNTLTSSLQIFIGGVSANLQYDGLGPNYLGLYQFNVVIPQVPANDATPITFTLAGTPSPQSLIISIGN